MDLEKQFQKLVQDAKQAVEKLTDEFGVEASSFTPQADVIEGSDLFLVHLDLPGMVKEEITLALSEGVLTIKGTRSLPLEEGMEIKRKERTTGAFIRSFALPENVRTSEIKASFKHGVLSVSIPKSEDESSSTNIPID